MPDKKDFLKIIDYYGLFEQLKYFQSEVYELNEAIIRYDEAGNNNFDGKSDKDLNEMKNHVAEEISDVLVMLKHFQYTFGFKDEKINEIVDYKVKRQLERIKDEKKGIKNEN